MIQLKSSTMGMCVQILNQVDSKYGNQRESTEVEIGNKHKNFIKHLNEQHVRF